MNVIYGGSSITNATDGYRELSTNWLEWTYLDTDFVFYNASQSGRTSWNNLLRIQADYLDHAPDLIIFDNANDDVAAIGRRAVEAMVRRIWTAYPDCKIVFMKVFNVADRFDDSDIETPVNSGQQVEFEAIADHYGIPLVPYWDQINWLVNGGARLFRYLIDTVHPTYLGHGEMSALLEPYLTADFLTTRQSPLSLPSRLYDNGDYENAAVVKNGNAYDSISGTWATNGTAISSSQAGAIVTYSGTLQSIGRPEEDGVVQVSIDGGAYAAITLGPNGATNAALATRGARTVAIKVMSGTVTISKFWGI